jgi:hypothetical protein
MPETRAIQTSVARNWSFEDKDWQVRQAERLDLMHTLRREARPSRKPAWGEKAR